MRQLKEKMTIEEFETILDDIFINSKDRRERKYASEEMKPLLKYAKHKKASFITYTGNVSENSIDGILFYSNGEQENIEITTITDKYKENIVECITREKGPFTCGAGETVDDLKNRTGYITKNKIKDKNIEDSSFDSGIIDDNYVLNKCEEVIMKKINKKDKYKDYTLLLTIGDMNSFIMEDYNFIENIKRLWNSIENNQFKNLFIIDSFT